MPAEPSSSRRCPNCDTPVASDRTRCPSCKLEVSMMDKFAAAKHAAQTRGLRTRVESQEQPTPPLISPRLIRAAVFMILLATVAGGIIRYTMFRPQPWESYPTSAEEAVTKLMKYIGEDSDNSLAQAYDLVGQEMSKDKTGDIRGRYLQLFHVAAKYLSGEFGSAWPSTVKIEVAKDDPNRFIVHIGLETLHIRTSLQTPADQRSDPAKLHYAVLAIEEFDINDAGKLQQMAGITGYINLYGAQGSVNQLNDILTARGGDINRETTMETKMRLLPVLRNPNANSLKIATTLAWKVRRDPVIQARLKSIVDDGRYPGDVQNTARQVLDGTLSEEDRIAAGLNT